MKCDRSNPADVEYLATLYGQWRGLSAQGRAYIGGRIDEYVNQNATSDGDVREAMRRAGVPAQDAPPGRRSWLDS